MREKISSTFLNCLALVLRPIVRFCLTHGIKFQDFTETAKKLFVQCALNELGRSNTPSSTSRLSVMTGLQRRDISRIIEERESPFETESLLGKVIGQWSCGQRFTDERGRARNLSIGGPDSEFAELVQSVSKDLNHHTLLFELERLGIVKRHNEKAVLCKPAYINAESPKEAFSMLASDIEDLVSAVEDNTLDNAEPPHLHAKTQFDAIPLQFLPTIRKWFLAKGTKFHQEARSFLSQFDKDINPAHRNKKGRARASIGTFSFIENTGETDETLDIRNKEK